VSEVNRSLYNAFAQPLVQNWVTAPWAESMRRLHPNRLRFAMFSDENPAMNAIERIAARVREERQPVSPDNPLRQVEERASGWISTSLRAYGELRDAMIEAAFLTAYGSPLLRACVGIDSEAPPQRRRIERDLIREAREAQQRRELESRFEAGTPAEAVMRAFLYVHEPDGGVDERMFAALRELRAASPRGEVRTAAQVKALVREQVQLLRLDKERSVQGIAKLLPHDARRRKEAWTALQRIVNVRNGALTDEGKQRLARVEKLFLEARAKESKARQAKVGAAHAAARNPRGRHRTREVSAPH
jgi:hypothetical protein